MAVRYVGMVTPAAGTQFSQAGRAGVIGAAAGGTLAGSQVVSIVFDDSVFGSTMEGKQELLQALETIKDAIECARSWPVDTTI